MKYKQYYYFTVESVWSERLVPGLKEAAGCLAHRPYCLPFWICKLSYTLFFVSDVTLASPSPHVLYIWS